MAFAVRKDWPQLANILNKSLESIPDSKRAKISNHWISVRFERGIDWTPIFQIVGALVLVGGVIFIFIIRWNRALSKEVTERKLAEEAIIESQERLNTILKTTAQGFWLVDKDDNILDVNKATCELIDLPREEIVGRNFWDFLDEENREIVREQNRIRKKGEQSIYEVSLLRPDGTPVPCLNNAAPLFDKDGNVVGSFGMTTNITERKHMEEELRRNVDELERFSKLAFGREKKMIQLKQEVNELMSQLGQVETYKIVK